MDENTVLVLIAIGCTVFICICVCGVAVYREFEAQREDDEYEFL